MYTCSDVAPFTDDVHQRLENYNLGTLGQTSSPVSRYTVILNSTGTRPLREEPRAWVHIEPCKLGDLSGFEHDFTDC